jgi:hypothetical protein
MLWDLDGRLLEVLAGLGAELERVELGAYLVTVRGRRTTHVWLIAGEQAVTVEAFVMHVLEGADTGALHRHLLRRNLSLRGVHFALDEVGDLFLAGSLSLADVTPAGVDRLLGEVWELMESTRLEELAYPGGAPAKALLDGAGRRPAGTPDRAPRRDPRR